MNIQEFYSKIPDGKFRYWYNARTMSQEWKDLKAWYEGVFGWWDGSRENTEQMPARYYGTHEQVMENAFASKEVAEFEPILQRYLDNCEQFGRNPFEGEDWYEEPKEPDPDPEPPKPDPEPETPDPTPEPEPEEKPDPKPDPNTEHQSKFDPNGFGKRLRKSHITLGMLGQEALYTANQHVRVGDKGATIVKVKLSLDEGDSIKNYRIHFEARVENDKLIRDKDYDNFIITGDNTFEYKVCSEAQSFIGVANRAYFVLDNFLGNNEITSTQDFNFIGIENAEYGAEGVKKHYVSEIDRLIDEHDEALKGAEEISKLVEKEKLVRRRGDTMSGALRFKAYDAKVIFEDIGGNDAYHLYTDHWGNLSLVDRLNLKMGNVFEYKQEGDGEFHFNRFLKYKGKEVATVADFDGYVKDTGAELTGDLKFAKNLTGIVFDGIGHIKRDGKGIYFRDYLNDKNIMSYDATKNFLELNPSATNVLLKDRHISTKGNLELTAEDAEIRFRDSISNLVVHKSKGNLSLWNNTSQKTGFTYDFKTNTFNIPNLQVSEGTNLAKKTGDTFTGDLTIQGDNKALSIKNSKDNVLSHLVDSNGVYYWYSSAGKTPLRYDLAKNFLTVNADTNLAKKTGDTFTGDLKLFVGDSMKRISSADSKKDLISFAFGSNGSMWMEDRQNNNFNVFHYDNTNKRFNLNADSNLMKKSNDTFTGLTRFDNNAQLMMAQPDNNTGASARGLHFIDKPTDIGTNRGGFGRFKGANDGEEYLYAGFGINPWDSNSGLIIRPTGNMTMKGKEVFHSGNMYKSWIASNGRPHSKPEGTDLNTLIESGLYQVHKGKNSPFEMGWTFVQVLSHTEQYIVQMAYRFGTDQMEQYMRVCQVGKWNPWKRMLHTEDDVARLGSEQAWAKSQVFNAGFRALSASIGTVANQFRMGVNETGKFFWLTPAIGGNADFGKQISLDSNGYLNVNAIKHKDDSSNWEFIPLTNGATQDEGYKATAIRTGTSVTVRFKVKRTSGAVNTVCVLPVKFRPQNTYIRRCLAEDGTSVVVEFKWSGEVNVNAVGKEIHLFETWTIPAQQL